MICGRRQCRRAARTAPFYCRCGLEFCSEACFIPEWYAEHQRTCPHGDAIRAEVAERQASSASRGGAALLVATALSHTKPVPVPPEPVPPPPPPAASTAGAASASPAAKKLKYVLADFESVGPPLGGGSYGKVTKVVHKKTSEVFAMKVIPKQKVVEHQMEDYLAREVKTQLRLQHPNILRLLYYFEDSEDVHLLLEFASGGSLFGVLKRTGRLPEADAARYYTDVAMALDHLHSKGVVHRDLKPENILMCEGDVAKLADFGWCAELDKGGAPRRTFCGTWDYLSPEMVNSEPHDQRVDIWAIGVLCFEMLTSRSPFAASSQVKALMRITKVDLQIPDYVSSLAGDLLRKLLVKEPDGRLPLAESVEHPWVKQFIPEVSMRLAESSAKNAAAVERAAAAALEASISNSQSDLDVSISTMPTQPHVPMASSERQQSPEESAAKSVEHTILQAGLEEASPVTATHGGSTDSMAESLVEVVGTPPVPDEPAVPRPMPPAADDAAKLGPSLSTMPWERSPQYEKALDATTPRTNAVSSSSLSSLSQSQATLDIPGRQGNTDIPNATAALLQALRDPSSPSRNGSKSSACVPQEELPEATANFLGALRGGSIAGRLQDTFGPALGPLPSSPEASGSTSSPSSQASSSHGVRYQERAAKKAEMHRARDKIAQRRAELELQRSVLEQEQQELEKQELELSQQDNVRVCTSDIVASPRHHRNPARHRTADSARINADREPCDVSPAMAKVCQQAALDLDTPRRTGSSEGSAYAELRSWVRRKTDNLRADGFGGATALEVSPPAGSARGKAGYPPSGYPRVGNDYMKLSKHSKWVGDDIDSTMSSVSSELSETRSRQRAGRIGYPAPPP